MYSVKEKEYSIHKFYTWDKFQRKSWRDGILRQHEMHVELIGTHNARSCHLWHRSEDILHKKYHFWADCCSISDYVESIINVIPP